MTTTREVREGGGDVHRRLLRDHWTQFESLVADSERALLRRRYERAAVLVQLAATFAWFNHPGVFASRRLEHVVARLGEILPESPAPARLPGAGGVLHVSTRIYQTGGHTQMVANWMTTDTAHAHRLCVTQQAGAPIPGKVREALEPGEAVHQLDAEADTVLGRARLLRRLARSADTVVLHVHPNDAVAAIALADPGNRRPVLLVNHADHVFWLGAGVASTVVNLRRSGEQLSIERRGVAPERNGVLIRPLPLRGRQVDRAEARRRLGLPAEGVLLVTAAAGSKYEPVGGLGFLDLVEPVLADCPEAHLVAAGPEAVGRWRRLEESGRGRALGLLPDAHAVFEAADVYLDSFPFSSLTSLLEAGSLGTPVVTVRPPTDGAEVLGADTPELDDDLIVARGPAELRRLVGGLVRDPRHRAAVGAATAAAIQSAHAEREWTRQVARLCASEGVRGPFPMTTPDVVRWGDLDQRVARVQQRTGIAQGLLGAMAMNSGYLSRRERLSVFAGLARRRSRPSPRLLLSARSSRWARRLRGVPASWREQRRTRGG